jgi:CheY-like chemotaxis protein
VVARDGAEALNCLHHRGELSQRRPGKPSLVLLDLKMPKVDGLEVLRQMRSDPELQLIPVVILTSSCEQTDVRRCYQFGANAYVVKPVDYPRFRETLQQVGAFWVAMNQPPPAADANVNALPSPLVVA